MKNASAAVVGLTALALLGLIGLAALPTRDWWWFALVILTGGALICLVAAGKGGQGAATKPAAAQRAPVARGAATAPAPTRPAAAPKKMTARVPLEGFGPGVWTPPGQAVTVGGVTIPGGMLYFGTSLKTHNGSVDPCLVDPSKEVAARGDYTARDLGAWPSYANISSMARRAYLNWLAGGRSDPAADIGYVYLFFFGLERRALIDPMTMPESRNDWPAIIAEVWRLLGIYGPKSARFRASANQLLSWLMVCDRPARVHTRPVPPFPASFELPLYIHYALGSAVADGAPIADHLALAWARLDPDIPLPAPAVRCPQEFDKLFLSHFSAAHGFGLTVRRNRTHLKFVYRAASPGFHGLREIQLSFSDMPDITVLTEPRQRVIEIVEAVARELEPYSRSLGRDAGPREPLESLLHLPAGLWPDTARVLHEQVGGEYLVMPFGDLLARLGVDTPFGSERIPALTRLLAFMHLGMAPTLRAGDAVPGPADPVVLYAFSRGETELPATPDYEAALLALRLAIGAALEEGGLGDADIEHLSNRVHAWSHLETNHQRRLMASLRLLVETPAPLASVQATLAPLDAASREFLAAVIASLLQAGSAPTADEARLLNRIYEALAVDEKPNPVRIAGLRRDQAKASALLATLFPEPPAPSAAPRPPVEPANDMPPGDTSLLGLDAAHTSVARLLLSRLRCRRDEFLDVVFDLDIRPDGALERLNNASFTKYGMAFTQGDDPIVVNPAVRQKIES